MPFKSERPNLQTSNYDDSLQVLNTVLSDHFEQMAMAEQAKQVVQVPFTQEDLGTPTPDEDITQFEPDPATMFWSTEARQKREYELKGITSEEAAEAQRIAANANTIQEHTLSTEEQEGYDFLQSLRQVENSGKYDSKPDKSMTGAYQFDWNQWGGAILAHSGAKSKQEFIDSPDMQDSFFNNWYKPNVLENESNGYMDKFKQHYPNATHDDLLAAWHLAGSSNIRNGLKDGSIKKWKDGNGTTIDEYLNRMHTTAPHNVALNDKIIPDAGVDVDLHPELSSKLNTLQKRLGTTIYLKSGHRDASRNAKAGGAKNSAHLRKLAADIDFERMGKANDIEFKRAFIREASDVGFLGVGVYNNNIHLDVDGELGRRAWGPNHHKESLPLWSQDVIAYHKNKK